ncbi:MAG: redox-sensing transcriptional repressor Rex [Anaerolineaceae bacterium]|nr:redox-sensing transcriptional repressor Rex [Anaerolineaceae bacterium]
MSNHIPTPSLKRIPMYHRELQRAMQSGIKFINSTQLGKALGIPSTQVRKDLSYIAEQGRPGVGYNTTTLTDTLEKFLGLHLHKKAVLAGVGNLANALIHFPGFNLYGIDICLLFDNDPEKIGEKLADKEIHHIDEIGLLLKKETVSIGIITTPAVSAQSVAQKMIAGGITSIWNFSPITLLCPDNIFVLNQDLSMEMAILSHSVINMD